MEIEVLAYVIMTILSMVVVTNLYIIRKVHKIMASQEELKLQVEEQTAKVVKITAEVQSLLTKIEELLAQITAGGQVTPELQAAVDALSAQVTVVDELVPDIATPERLTKKSFRS